MNIEYYIKDIDFPEERQGRFQSQRGVAALLVCIVSGTTNNDESFCLELRLTSVGKEAKHELDQILKTILEQHCLE